jgi:hypothetical protein
MIDGEIDADFETAELEVGTGEKKRTISGHVTFRLMESNPKCQHQIRPRLICIQSSGVPYMTSEFLVWFGPEISGCGGGRLRLTRREVAWILNDSWKRRTCFQVLADREHTGTSKSQLNG